MEREESLTDGRDLAGERNPTDQRRLAGEKNVAGQERYLADQAPRPTSEYSVVQGVTRLVLVGQAPIFQS